MIAESLFSSKTDQWATPPELFDRIARRYGPFELDVCALPGNAKCSQYFSPEQDGLKQTWSGRCWCNPPYGRKIGRWVKRAWESSTNGATVVCLLPARTDTKWWHEYVIPYARIEYLRGRVHFGDSANGAPFPSAVAVFESARQYRCRRCDRLFVPVRTDAKFCSLSCKQAAYRARRVTAKSVTGRGEE